MHVTITCPLNLYCLLSFNRVIFSCRRCCCCWCGGLEWMEGNGKKSTFLVYCLVILGLGVDKIINFHKSLKNWSFLDKKIINGGRSWWKVVAGNNEMLDKPNHSCYSAYFKSFSRAILYGIFKNIFWVNDGNCNFIFKTWYSARKKELMGKNLLIGSGICIWKMSIEQRSFQSRWLVIMITWKMRVVRYATQQVSKICLLCSISYICLLSFFSKKLCT